MRVVTGPAGYAREWLAAYLLPATGAVGLTDEGLIKIETYNGYANGGYERAVAAIAYRPGFGPEDQRGAIYCELVMPGFRPPFVVPDFQSGPPQPSLLLGLIFVSVPIGACWYFLTSFMVPDGYFKTVVAVLAGAWSLRLWRARWALDVFSLACVARRVCVFPSA